MKKNVAVINVLLIFSLISCGTIQQTISVDTDAKIAEKLQVLNVKKFDYEDFDGLQQMLHEQIRKYEMGLAYLKKSADLYKESESGRFHKNIDQVYIEINFLRATIDNFKHYYPEDWKSVQSDLSSRLKSIKEKYQTAYKALM